MPLTLAIMPTLMVMLGNQAFAFPLVNVSEIFHLDLSRTNVVDGQEVVIVRDRRCRCSTSSAGWSMTPLRKSSAKVTW